MDKDFLKFMSFVAFMEAKKEAERDCSVKATEWQDTIPTIRKGFYGYRHHRSV